MDGKNSGRGVIKAFCNNFNGAFSIKAQKNVKSYSIDDYVAGLFALMPPGSVLVTLEKLDMGLSRADANKERGKHGLPQNDLASFFNMEEFEIGEGRHFATWFGGGNRKKVKVYKYTRLCQQRRDADGSEAVFLCCNVKCKFAESSQPIEATKMVEQDGSEKIVINCCPNCKGCGIINSRSRERKKNEK